jgi:hypothetical protein
MGQLSYFYTPKIKSRYINSYDLAVHRCFLAVAVDNTWILVLTNFVKPFVCWFDALILISALASYDSLFLDNT